MKRSFTALFLVITAIAIKGCSQPTKICSDTAFKYNILRDDPDSAQAYAGLFSVDGIFALNGEVFQGRPALRARHTAAHEAATWKHSIISQLVIPNKKTPSGQGKFKVESFSKIEPGAERYIVARYNDNYVVKNGKCLIKSRTIKILSDVRVSPPPGGSKE